MTKNRYRWKILAEKRREEARIDILLGFVLPIGIVIFSIFVRLYA